MLLIHFIKDSQCCGPNREAFVFKENGAGPKGEQFHKEGYVVAGVYEVKPLVEWLDGLTSTSVCLPFECEVKRLPGKPVPNK